MKHYVPNHLLDHEDGALLVILLIILNQLTKYEASIYNVFLDIPFIRFQWLNLQKAKQGSHIPFRESGRAHGIGKIRSVLTKIWKCTSSTCMTFPLLD